MGPQTGDLMKWQVMSDRLRSLIARETTTLNQNRTMWNVADTCCRSRGHLQAGDLPMLRRQCNRTQGTQA